MSKSFNTLKGFTHPSDRRMSSRVRAIRDPRTLINVSEDALYWSGTVGAVSDGPIQVAVQGEGRIAWPFAMDWKGNILTEEATVLPPFPLAPFEDGSPLPIEAIRQVAYAMGVDDVRSQLNSVLCDFSAGTVVALDGTIAAVATIPRVWQGGRVWLPRQVVLGLLALPKKGLSPIYRTRKESGHTFVDIYTPGVRLRYRETSLRYPIWQEAWAEEPDTQREGVNAKALLEAVQAVNPAGKPNYKNFVQLDFSEGTVQWGRTEEMVAPLPGTVPIGRSDTHDVTWINVNRLLLTLKQHKGEVTLRQTDHNRPLIIDGDFRSVIMPMSDD